MKKITLLLTVLSVIFIFASCSKDHGSTLKIKGEVQNGTYNATCTNVRAIANDANSTEIARGDFSNGSFSLTLPKDVPASILTPITVNDFVDFDLGFDISVSNPDTKGVNIYFEAYKGNDDLDELIYAGQSTSGSAISFPSATTLINTGYIYADSKCTFKGSGTINLGYGIDDEDGDIDIYVPVTIDADYTVYKGWTKIYITTELSISGSLILPSISYKISASNKEPKNSNMKWYFSQDFYSYLPNFAPLSTEQRTIASKLFKKVR